MKILIVITGNRARILTKLPYDIEQVLLRKLGYYKIVWKPDFKTGLRRRTEELITKYDCDKHSFPVGMILRAKKFFKSRGMPVKVLDKRTRPSVNASNMKAILSTMPFTLRPYQTVAVECGLENPAMTFHMATGSGKTIVAAALAKVINRKTLVIVHRDDLMRQHFKDFKKFFPERKVVKFTGPKTDVDADIVIAMVPTIQARFKTNKHAMEKYLRSIGHLIGDESHHSRARTWKRVYNNCKNAEFKHSFSGSPWDTSSQNIELEAVSGPIMFRYTTSHAIQDGYLSQPIIRFHHYRNNKKSVRAGNMHRVYEECILQNDYRNMKIAEIVYDYWKTTGQRTMVIVNRIAHGHIIERKLLLAGIPHRDIGYLHGSKGTIVRERGRKQFEKGKIPIMIVSNIWNEGIDIPACDILIKADAFGGGIDEYNEGEGVRAFVQQIGRVLRKPKPDGSGDIDPSVPHTVYVHDFVDLQHKYVRNWTNNRYQTCVNESAFKVEIDENT